eukprot:COSAG02_NODE_2795_length_8014_cov_4.340114_2_plen_144_part_00
MVLHQNYTTSVPFCCTYTPHSVYSELYASSIQSSRHTRNTLSISDHLLVSVWQCHPLPLSASLCLCHRPRAKLDDLRAEADAPTRLVSPRIACTGTCAGKRSSALSAQVLHYCSPHGICRPAISHACERIARIYPLHHCSLWR